MKKPPFTSKEIDALPTILDIVENLSKLENELILPEVSTVPSSQFYDEGRYNYVSDNNNRNIARLMPTSQSPFKFFRGQSRYHSPCVPSLFRETANGIPTDEDIAANRIKICEFRNLIMTHPVFREVSYNTYPDIIAIAQHYGLATDYLDITNSKWVAAFFASTRYDYNSDTYIPVGRDYAEGYGVMYISNEFNESNWHFFNQNCVIGYQYFARPSKQSSFGYKLSIGEDFDESPYFDKLFFRHDLESSQIVFEMSYRQNRFIPKDILSKLARTIGKSTEVTRCAINNCWNIFYKEKELTFLENVCKYKNWKIREDNKPIVEFSKNVLQSDWDNWVSYGRENLQSRILPIIPVAAFKL